MYGDLVVSLDIWQNFIARVLENIKNEERHKHIMDHAISTFHRSSNPFKAFIKLE